MIKYFLLLLSVHSKTIHLIEVFRHGARTSLSHNDKPPLFESNLAEGSLTPEGMK